MYRSRRHLGMSKFKDSVHSPKILRATCIVEREEGNAQARVSELVSFVPPIRHPFGARSAPRSHTCSRRLESAESVRYVPARKPAGPFSAIFQNNL